MRYTFDTRDRDVLWQDGTMCGWRISAARKASARVDSLRAHRRHGGDLALPFGDNVGYLRASGGSSFGTHCPCTTRSRLGGPVSMPGFSLGELRGSNYWSAQASYLQRIADISYVFGQSIYAGLNFTAADIAVASDWRRTTPCIRRASCWRAAHRSAR